ncbi:ribulose-phosphate 3-epimerase [Sporanaerobium hydrogeniformans]|uniref:Ribulose-phosphate 3-epimerase n=1 Tax=Sporanaerobium hydrogeniformans TaxID=3072179 RepID=A0AC61DFJ3_9FIRM|nr:ribulose-phosphate 3-epimerase [Sporanaerobium hydrogeniformans]PHV71808.1 ribulose-phosphate 3-epimerase [Sporanaerobium hydrogeniformans]
MIHLDPSILAADFANLERDIRCVQEVGVEYIHVDVMDGQFVPNISIGLPVVKSLRKHITGVMDVHLMIEEPERFLEDFKEAGADILTVHLEATHHIHRTIQRIHDLGMKAGISINPGTPVSALEAIINDVDLVLIMSVNPGFGGQKFIPYSLEKLRQVKAMLNKARRDILIQVDGGATLDNVQTLIDAGANLIVAGSSVFEGEKTAANAKAFLELFKGCGA